jgi:hypothetical protein
MTVLHHLLDLVLAENEIGVQGCTALAALLKNSASRIYFLALGRNNIDDDCIAILIETLEKNSTLKTFFSVPSMKKITLAGD